MQDFKNLCYNHIAGAKIAPKKSQRVSLIKPTELLENIKINLIFTGLTCDT